jgi:hypothetical protein
MSEWRKALPQFFQSLFSPVFEVFDIFVASFHFERHWTQIGICCPYQTIIAQGFYERVALNSRPMATVKEFCFRLVFVCRSI